MYRRGMGTRNPYASLARAVAASGLFRLRLGRVTLGERLDWAYAAATKAAFRVLSPWWESRFVNALRAIVPPALLRMVALQSWEPETTRLFQRLLRPGMTVVDAGAQIGYYTVLSAMAVGPAGRVYAFEPDPDSLPLLRRNVRLSGYEGFVTVVPMALSDGLGQVKLFLGKGNDVTSIYRTGDWGRGSAKVDKESAMVEKISLDAYFAGLGWPAVDLVKMDIEGAEKLALKGMKELVRRNPHLKLISEFCPWLIKDSGATPEEFCDALVEARFRRFWAISRELEPVLLPKELPRLVEMALKDEDGRVNLLCDGSDAS